MFWIYIRTCVTEKLKYHPFPLILQKKKKNVYFSNMYISLSLCMSVIFNKYRALYKF